MHLFMDWLRHCCKHESRCNSVWWNERDEKRDEITVSTVWKPQFCKNKEINTWKPRYRRRLGSVKLMLLWGELNWRIEKFSQNPLQHFTVTTLLVELIFQTAVYRKEPVVTLLPECITLHYTSPCFLLSYPRMQTACFLQILWEVYFNVDWS